MNSEETIKLPPVKYNDNDKMDTDIDLDDDIDDDNDDDVIYSLLLMKNRKASSRDTGVLQATWHTLRQLKLAVD